MRGVAAAMAADADAMLAGRIFTGGGEGGGALDLNSLDGRLHRLDAGHRRGGGPDRAHGEQHHDQKADRVHQELRAPKHDGGVARVAGDVAGGVSQEP